MASPLDAALWLWLVWFVTWWMAAVFAAKAAARPKLGVGVLHRVFASLGIYLLFLDRFLGTANTHSLALAPFTRALWSAPAVANWTLVGLVAASFAFCWWARIHLGRLWSGLTTVKEDHRVVDTGPYGVVRHPIYAGAIAAAFFTALIEASIAGLAGAALVLLGFWMTARQEEAFLRQALGAAAYDAYSARVKMLIPGLG